MSPSPSSARPLSGTSSGSGSEGPRLMGVGGPPGAAALINGPQAAGEAGRGLGGPGGRLHWGPACSCGRATQILHFGCSAALGVFAGGVRAGAGSQLASVSEIRAAGQTHPAAPIPRCGFRPRLRLPAVTRPGRKEGVLHPAPGKAPGGHYGCFSSFTGHCTFSIMIVPAEGQPRPPP